MGCCFSVDSEETTKRSEAIDKYLHDERKKASQNKDLKILLLGAGESGKSTIAKQMKIIHMNGYSQSELAEFKPAIHKNVMESAKSLIDGIDKLGLQIQNPEVKAQFDALKAKCVSSDMLQVSVDPGCATMIKAVWMDKAAQDALQRTNEFYIMDSAIYFFENIERIAAADYIPTEDDVLRSRVKSTGITETKFSIDKLNIHMFDVGGQRSERKKWIHCFEGVTSVIFVVALSEYDQVLLEDASQNRMVESLVLFESIVNSKWFLKASIILFLNKIDLFKEKLKRAPLSKYFPEYAGDDDFTKASKFMLWRFKQVNRQNLMLYPHLTCATDTSQIRIVFSAVKDTLIKNSLKDSGIM